MNVNDTDLLGLITKKMGYLTQTQTLHAENIANATTPGYKAREAAPFSFKDAMRQSASVGMTTTDARHIIPASMAGANAASHKVKGYDTSPDGNAVDLEKETMESTKANIDYQMMTTLFKQITSMFRIAVKGS